MLTVPARIRTWPATVVVLVVLAILWFVLGQSDLALFAAGIGYAIAAIGVDISTGYAGQPNFGQAAFMGIGCYGASALQGKAGFTFIEAFLAAVVLCALVATVLGFAAVRLEHLGFGIVTFVFAFAVAAFLEGNTLAGLTGGPNGLEIPESSVFGNLIASPKPLYLFGVVVLAIGAYLVHSFVRSRSGRAMLTAKGNERVAATLGVELIGVKLRAFALSAALGGAGGIIIGEGSGFVTPDSFPPALSITVFGMAALGGMGTITGPILGAMFFWLVPNYVSALSTYQEVFVAGVFLLVLIVIPSGVVGVATDLLTGRRPTFPWSRGNDAASGFGASEDAPATATEGSLHGQ